MPRLMTSSCLNVHRFDLASRTEPALREERSQDETESAPTDLDLADSEEEDDERDADSDGKIWGDDTIMTDDAGVGAPMSKKRKRDE
ncbi:hypothetical protein BDZ45DRAFT_795963 [Acephala macrosclerotiorum]|nr:hypothetical protein BDZ45DRAFT_795963 [Acephala macrosclerotiorum]